MITSPYNNKGCYRTAVRSFVCRKGRLTKRQKLALDSYWSKFGVNFSYSIVDFKQIFGRTAPVIVEIGFGMGHSLIAMAQQNQYKNFLGIEVYPPGVGACLSAAENYKLSNLRIVYYDAVEVLAHMIPDNSLDTIQLFFPDPWHKKRHHKRRIIQPSFVQLIKKKLIIGGSLYLVTDCQNYAEYILQVMTDIPEYCNLSPNNDYMVQAMCRPITKFEKRAKQLGYPCWNLMFQKIA